VPCLLILGGLGRRELYGRILGDWTERDRRALAGLMRRLNESLDRHTRKP
jgi:hypothetical protein